MQGGKEGRKGTGVLFHTLYPMSAADFTNTLNVLTNLAVCPRSVAAIASCGSMTIVLEVSMKIAVVFVAAK